jgi:hypothetical protein
MLESAVPTFLEQIHLVAAGRLTSVAANIAASPLAVLASIAMLELRSAIRIVTQIILNLRGVRLLDQTSMPPTTFFSAGINRHTRRATCGLAFYIQIVAP